MKFNYKIKFKSLQQLIDNKFKRRIYNNINHICIGDKVYYYIIIDKILFPKWIQKDRTKKDYY